MTSIISPEVLSTRIRAHALSLGFDRVGIAPVMPSGHAASYRAWIEAGYAGEMGYLAREDAVAKRADPSLVVPGARSAIVVSRNYLPEEDPHEEVPVDRGVFARYARNEDYHDVLTPRLRELQSWLAEQVEPLQGRVYFDTGPVLERELAVRAGLGWYGKNTMLIQPRTGSYHFLGVLLIDLPLAYDEPFAAEHCGSCTRCLDQCPTGALLGRDLQGGAVMDARRCISYLTIELKGPIPHELRPLLGNRIYGCDICQEVCPHNNQKFVQLTREEAFWPRAGVHGAKLIELMALTQEEFSRRFRKSPVKRAKRRGLLRNVAIALGNWGSPEAVPVLVAALADHEPLVRGHSAWALGRIRSAAGLAALEGRVQVEEDAWVLQELALAIAARQHCAS